MQNKSEQPKNDKKFREVSNSPNSIKTSNIPGLGLKNFPSNPDNRYWQLFETFQDGICILNAATGRIEDLNRSLIELFGGEKENYLSKEIWETDLFLKSGLEKTFINKIKEYEDTLVRKIVLPIKDGSSVIVEFSASLFGSADAQHIQCTFRNTTRQKKKVSALEKNIQKRDTMLKELQHRAKNTFSMITGLIELKSYESDSPETEQELQELSMRIKSISDLYTLLYETDSTHDVEMDAYCKMVGRSILGEHKNIAVEYEMEEISIPAKIASSVGIILVELLYNSMKYAFPNRQKGSIKISLTQNSKFYRLTVKDNGRGLPDNFKIVETNGSGLHLVQRMAHQLNGTAEFKSQAGTTSIVEFRV